MQKEIEKCEEILVAQETQYQEALICTPSGTFCIWRLVSGGRTSKTACMEQI